MMEFLDKIYGYEHFGIILFAIIAVLVVLFLIVLLFGKKDEKKRELERTQQLAASQTADAFAPVNEAPNAVNVNEPAISPVDNIVPQAPVAEPFATVLEEVPIIPTEPIIPIEPVVPEVQIAQTPIIESSPVAPVLEPPVAPELVTPMAPVMPVMEPVVQPEVKLEPVNIPTPEAVVTPVINEEPEIEIPNFNFDELAASIANELNSLENKPVASVSQKSVEPIIPVEPVVAPVRPINEVVKPVPTPGPAVFSSVYLNKPDEPVKEAQVVEPVVPANPVTPEVPVQPVTPPPVQNPGIELPKPAEMPILNKEVKEPVNNIPNAIPDFSQFEGESYELK